MMPYYHKTLPKWTFGRQIKTYGDAFSNDIERFFFLPGDDVEKAQLLRAWWVRDVWSPRMLRAAVRGHRLFVAVRNPEACCRE